MSFLRCLVTLRNGTERETDASRWEKSGKFVPPWFIYGPATNIAALSGNYAVRKSPNQGNEHA